MSPAAIASESAASACEVLWDRDAEWARRLAMVDQARSFLYLSVFYLEWDDYGRPMCEALLRAQRRGVQVQLIIDGFGQRLGGVLMTRSARQALAAALDALRAAGGQVVMYQPARWLQRRLAGGHHVKIQVSDAGELVLASGNITASSFAHWNECAVALRGPVVLPVFDSLAAIGGHLDATHRSHLAALNPGQPGDIPVEYWFCNPNGLQGPMAMLGWRGANLVTDRMVAMVQAARHSLRITSFYFKPTPVLMEAVLDAARRGVAVEIHHSHRDALPATDLAWIAAATSYRRLLSAGVRLYERLEGEHSKIVLVDDAWVAYGSYNFEDAAHDRLAEAMLASRDPRLVEPARAIFAGRRADSGNQQVTAADVDAWPARVQQRVRRYGRFKRWM